MSKVLFYFNEDQSVIFFSKLIRDIDLILFALQNSAILSCIKIFPASGNVHTRFYLYNVVYKAGYLKFAQYYVIMTSSNMTGV